MIFTTMIFTTNVLVTMTSVINFCASITITALGIVIFISGKKNPINQLFMLFSLFLGFWTLSSTLSDVMHAFEPALFWAQLSILGPFYFPAFFLIFSHFFPKPSGRLPAFKAILILLPSIIVSLLAPTSLNIVEIRLASWGTDFTPGLLYPIGILYLFMYLGLAAVNFTRAKKKENDPNIRRQVDLVFYGIALVVFSLILTNGILPIVFNYARASVLGPAAGLIFTAFTTYAIMKHQLLNIKIIATEVFAVTLSMVMLVQVFTADAIGQLAGRSLTFLATAIFGSLLIRSVREEVRRREEIQNLAAKLEISNKRLKQLDELKTTMVGIASHQIRGPLGGIRGYMSMFHSGDLGPLTEKQRDIVALNLNVLSRLINAVETFLDITKIEAGKVTLSREIIDPNEVIEPIIEEFRIPMQKRGLEFDYRLDARAPLRINVDPEKTKHIIFNLIDNAMKYTRQGSVTVSLHSGKGGIVCEVTDTGMGVSTEDLPRLFGKFERGDLVVDRGGSGLGLYVVKMLSELQGGKVWVTSPGVNKGATFAVSFPLAK